MKKIKNRKDVDEILKLLINSQDRVLILLFYKNICNSSMEVRNIKISDIDFSQKTIKIGDKIKKLDEEIIGEIKKCITDSSYYFMKEGTHNKGFYDFNMSSEYLIKTKPTIISNQGTLPLTYDGLRSKFKTINSVTNYKISTVSLNTLGIIEELKNKKRTYTLKEIEEYLNENNINVSSYRIYNLLKFNVNQ